MDYGIALGVVGVVIAIAGVGVTMPASTPGEFRFVRWCFVLAAASMVASALMVHSVHEMPLWTRSLIAALVGAVAIGGLTFALGWVRQKQEAIKKVEAQPPSYSGKIEAEKSELLLSSKDHVVKRRMEIGDSGAVFEFTGPAGDPLFEFAKDYNLKIESVDGELKVSTKIRDPKRLLVAELIRNEWKVAPPPNSWDRNYNKDTVEVKNSSGDIVLQVRALPDRIQIQGEWWMDEVNGVRFVKDPKGSGAFMTKFGTAYRPEHAPATIQPLFVYPSQTHLGELRK
jgi:hypothetical protein